MKELMEKRARLIAEARGLVDGAEKAQRTLDEGERTRYDAVMAEIESLNERIERNQRLGSLEAAMQASAGRALPAAAIGMTQREVQQYSLIRAINASAKNDWRGAELEKEASDAVAKSLGREARGFFVPFEWQMERRDMTTTDAAGGYTIATNLLAQSFIELLRNRMVVRAAGATVLSGLVGDVAIPKQTGGATAYWVAENVAPTESTPATGQVTLAPKTVGAYVDISRKLLKQSSLDIEAFVRNDLASTLALAIDAAALHGSGAGSEPTGIAAVSGIGSVVGGAQGAAPDWADIIDLETAVAQDNADIGRVAYMTNAKVRGKLKQTAKVGSTDSVRIWSEDNQAPLNGYPAWVTNQVSSTLTKGTVTTCSAIFFGNWADLIIGTWGTLDLMADPYTASTTGAVRVVALQDVDIAVRHEESFAAMLDALTA